MIWVLNSRGCAKCHFWANSFFKFASVTAGKCLEGSWANNLNVVSFHYSVLLAIYPFFFLGLFVLVTDQTSWIIMWSYGVLSTGWMCQASFVMLSFPWKLIRNVALPCSIFLSFVPSVSDRHSALTSPYGRTHTRFLIHDDSLQMHYS